MLDDPAGTLLVLEELFGDVVVELLEELYGGSVAELNVALEDVDQVYEVLNELEDVVFELAVVEDVEVLEVVVTGLG